MHLAGWILLAYAASVVLVTCLLRLIADPYQHFASARDWWDCFRVALVWPWQVLRVAGYVAWDFWETRFRD